MLEMSFLSFSLSYYENKINQYENTAPSKADVYEAKQLLKMLDDLVDEGYEELSLQVEEQFHGVTRLKRLLSACGETPFPVIPYLEKSSEGRTETQELGACISDLVEKAAECDTISDNPILGDIVKFCEWVGYDDDTAYVFLLRDAMLPYIYFSQSLQGKSCELYPWLIGRKYMDFISPGHYIDDIVRAPFFDALEAGSNSFEEFKAFCKKKILSDLQAYPEVLEALQKLLGTIQKEKILVIESGCYGTFPMLLAVLDERVDFRMFTTVPFLNNVYGERIFTRAYEKNRLFETLYSQDKLFQFENFRDGAFYVSKKLDEQVLQKSLGEVKRML